ncbi:MAG: hypothetical protein JXJ30_08715 [Halothiobacillaceae bacterium]|nr:hypothetical protein [Halothiobacillaceae bacterium]HER34833.1 hypothetical protein [Halothiobacillaceae bacterium]
MSDILDGLRRRLEQDLAEIGELVDATAPQTLEAAGVILSTVLNGQRVLCCGARERNDLAHYFARLMTGQLEHPRPGLPVMALSEYPGGKEPFVRSIRALGAQQDVLFAVSCNAVDGVLPAVRAAHERDMQVVLLSAGSEDVIAPHLESQDRLICIATERRGIAYEAQLRSLHILVDLIDRQLLGLTD